MTLASRDKIYVHFRDGLMTIQLESDSVTLYGTHVAKLLADLGNEKVSNIVMRDAKLYSTVEPNEDGASLRIKSANSAAGLNRDEREMLREAIASQAYRLFL